VEAAAPNVAVVATTAAAISVFLNIFYLQFHEIEHLTNHLFVSYFFYLSVIISVLLHSKTKARKTNIDNLQLIATKSQ
ncbi:MAG: hypothetical protein P8I03_03690, partial [Thalassotalea sp.]|nr:hypothetical protein [Thalassotalea sp.]